MSAVDLDPITRYEEDQPVDGVDQRLDPTNGGRDSARERRRITCQYAGVFFADQRWIGADEIGVFTQDDPVSLPCIVEYARIRTSEFDDLADERDVVAFTAKR